jgi:hypothetical protein
MKYFYYALLVVVVVFTILALDCYKSEEKSEDNKNILKVEKESEIELIKQEPEPKELLQSEEAKCPHLPVVEVIEEKIEVIKVDTGRS